MSELNFNSISRIQIPNNTPAATYVEIGSLSVEGGPVLWRKKIPLTVNINPAGSGSVIYGTNPNIVEFVKGETVKNYIYWGLPTSISAVPASGKKFLKWDDETTTASRTIAAITNATESKTITANFGNNKTYIVENGQIGYWEGSSFLSYYTNISMVPNGSMCYFKVTDYSYGTGKFKFGCSNENPKDAEEMTWSTESRIRNYTSDNLFLDSKSSNDNYFVFRGQGESNWTGKVYGSVWYT